MTIGKGVRRELALSRRALRVAIAHLNVAKQGLRDSNDKVAAFLRADLLEAVDTLSSLGASKVGKRSVRKEEA